MKFLKLNESYFFFNIYFIDELSLAIKILDMEHQGGGVIGNRFPNFLCY